MELEHSFTIPVPPEQAWQVLLDVERIAPCMPGATVDSVDNDVISGRIKVKVGPVALTYAGTARFVERDETSRTVVLEASGKETRGSGTASATVHSSLKDESGQTRVVVRTTMSVTGRPAQFGRGVMAEVGGRIIERFATNLATQLAGGQETSGGGQPAADQAGPPAADAPSANSAGPGTTIPGPAAQASATSIEELHLPVRAFNALRREGIHTLGDLSARSEGELLAIENLGPQSVREIKQRLADRGFSLALGAETVPGRGETAASARSGDVGGADSRATQTAVSGAGAAAGTANAAADGVAAGAGLDAGAGIPGEAAAAPDSAATGYTAPPTASPPDEDAIDLLSVAGLPVLKRALPAAGVLAVLLMAFLRLRRSRRRANS
jgi:carbon monoxide dehydrogenase subunit G